MEIDGFLCSFCHKLKPDDELAEKTIDARLKCADCLKKKGFTVKHYSKTDFIGFELPRAIDKHEAEVDLSNE